MKDEYYVVPDVGDGCGMPTSPEPMPLAETGAHMDQKIKGWGVQGYYFDCRQKRIPIETIVFRVVHADNWEAVYNV